MAFLQLPLRRYFAIEQRDQEEEWTNRSATAEVNGAGLIEIARLLRELGPGLRRVRSVARDRARALSSDIGRWSTHCFGAETCESFVAEFVEVAMHSSQRGAIVLEASQVLARDFPALAIASVNGAVVRLSGTTWSPVAVQAGFTGSVWAIHQDGAGYVFFGDDGTFRVVP